MFLNLLLLLLTSTFIHLISVLAMWKPIRQIIRSFIATFFHNVWDGVNRCRRFMVICCDRLCCICCGWSRYGIQIIPNSLGVIGNIIFQAGESWIHVQCSRYWRWRFDEHFRWSVNSIKVENFRSAILFSFDGALLKISWFRFRFSFLIIRFGCVYEWLVNFYFFTLGRVL